jgi:hypothetical protein
MVITLELAHDAGTLEPVIELDEDIGCKSLAIAGHLEDRIWTNRLEVVDLARAGRGIRAQEIVWCPSAGKAQIGGGQRAPSVRA